MYTGSLKLRGRFDWQSFPSDRAVPHWKDARLMISVTDARGLSGAQELRWQGEEVELAAGTTGGAWGNGMHAAVPVDLEKLGDFELDLSLDGSGLMALVLSAEETEVRLSSPWVSPSFKGAFLPKSREIDQDGFWANWVVGKLGRNLPRHWSRSTSEDEAIEARRSEMNFGVSLVPAVSDYLMVERAMKYGLLFFVTIFGGFFLFEVTGARSLHGLNYLLVGGAVGLFYLALLSLSEFWAFGWAYLLAASAATWLILLYAKAVLRDGRSPGVVTGELGGIFGYLFLVLRMEELSLVAGTVLLFVLLGAIMDATRNLEGSRRLPRRANNEAGVFTEVALGAVRVVADAAAGSGAAGDSIGLAHNGNGWTFSYPSIRGETKTERNEMKASERNRIFSDWLKYWSWRGVLLALPSGLYAGMVGYGNLVTVAGMAAGIGFWLIAYAWGCSSDWFYVRVQWGRFWQRLRWVMYAKMLMSLVTVMGFVFQPLGLALMPDV